MTKLWKSQYPLITISIFLFFLLNLQCKNKSLLFTATRYKSEKVWSVENLNIPSGNLKNYLKTLLFSTCWYLPLHLFWCGYKAPKALNFCDNVKLVNFNRNTLIPKEEISQDQNVKPVENKSYYLIFKLIKWVKKS